MCIISFKPLKDDILVWRLIERQKKRYLLLLSIVSTPYSNQMTIYKYEIGWKHEAGAHVMGWNMKVGMLQTHSNGHRFLPIKRNLMEGKIKLTNIKTTWTQLLRPIWASSYLDFVSIEHYGFGFSNRYIWRIRILPFDVVHPFSHFIYELSWLCIFCYQGPNVAIIIALLRMHILWLKHYFKILNHFLCKRLTC